MRVNILYLGSLLSSIKALLRLYQIGAYQGSLALLRLYQIGVHIHSYYET